MNFSRNYGCKVRKPRAVNKTFFSPKLTIFFGEFQFQASCFFPYMTLNQPTVDKNVKKYITVKMK